MSFHSLLYCLCLLPTRAVAVRNNSGNMDDIDGGDDTHETGDPLFGIFPDRNGDDYIDDNDTFCAVCGVPLNVLVSDRIGIFRTTLGLIRSLDTNIRIETEKFYWCLDAVAFRPSSLQRGTDWETSRWHPDRNTKTERFHGDGKPPEILLIDSVCSLIITSLIPSFNLMKGILNFINGMHQWDLEYCITALYSSPGSGCM